jgi:integrase
MLRLCPATLAGSRDRALLALGFAGAFRRSELVALEVADLTEAPDGLRVRIPPQQYRPERRGRRDRPSARLPRRPVEAMQAWMAAAEISDGPLFPPVLKGGRIQREPLSAFSAAQFVKRNAEGRPRPGGVCRAQPAQRVPHQRSRIRRVDLEDDGGLPSQVGRRAARLCAASRFVP